MNTERLQERGFVQVRPEVWVKLGCRDGACRGFAVWSEGGATFFGGASFPLEQARRLVTKLCAVLGKPEGEAKKAQARRVLSALLMTDLEHGSVEGEAVASDVDVVIEGIVEGWRDRWRERRARRRKRRKARLARFRKSLHRLAQRVAKNKVLQKLRKGYAKVIKGPVGKAAASMVASALNVFGVPKKATELAIRAHHNRVADRMEKGGWAGVVERGTGKGGSIKSVLREEGRRFGRGWKDSVRASLPAVGEVVYDPALNVWRVV